MNNNRIKDLKIHIKHNAMAMVDFMNIEKLIIRILLLCCKFMNMVAKYAAYANIENN